MLSRSAFHHPSGPPPEKRLWPIGLTGAADRAHTGVVSNYQILKQQAAETETCRKCRGTGRINAVADFGRCWNCDTDGQAPTRAARKAKAELSSLIGAEADAILEDAWRAATYEFDTTDTFTLRRLVSEALEAAYQVTGDPATGVAAIQAHSYGVAA